MPSTCGNSSAHTILIFCLSCVLYARCRDYFLRLNTYLPAFPARNANEAPVKFVPYVRAALWPIVEKHAISWADAIQVSGAVGAQFLGKKDAFTLKVVRAQAMIYRFA